MAEILNCVNPDDETLRYWASSYDIYLTEQDEDLLLCTTGYLDIFLELMDEDCVKADIISDYSMRPIVRQATSSGAIPESIKSMIDAKRGTQSEILKRWIVKFDDLLKMTEGRGSLSMKDAKAKANKMLRGLGYVCEVKLSDRQLSSHWEFVADLAPRIIRRPHFYVEKSTGRVFSNAVKAATNEDIEKHCSQS